MYIYTHYRRKYENMFECCSVLQYFFMHYSVLQYCRSVLQCFCHIYAYVYMFTNTLGLFCHVPLKKANYIEIGE